MEPVNLVIDARWVGGLVLSMTRVLAFVVASPLLSRIVPVSGRMALVLAAGLFLAAPLTATPDLAGLVSAGLTNAAVGITLGWLTGVLFTLFASAGAFVDFTSGLSVSQAFDPTMNEQAAVFSRLFNLAALVLFAVSGGLELLIRGFARSIEVIPLDGSISPDRGLGLYAADLVGMMLLAAVELAFPVLATLLLLELVLGIASRFAPQANVFMLGLPAKILVTLMLLSVTVVFLPETLGGVMNEIADTFTTTLHGLSAR